MGELRNSGIVRKTIANGINVTTFDGIQEAKHARKRRPNHTRCCVYFGLACLLHIFHFGCSPADECDGPHVACDGNIAVTCASRPVNELQSYLELRREPCAERFCRTSNGTAFCALDSTDDSDCPVAHRDSYQASGCVGDELTSWRYGARISAETCADGTTCLALDGACSSEAYCVPDTNPEPLCAGAFTGCVDEHIIAYCRCGFQIDAHGCKNPGPRCVIEDSVAVCRP